MQQSSLRAARGYADRRVRWSNRSAPPASVASSAPSNAGGKQLAPMRSRISCIDAESPLAQNLSHQSSISEFLSAALQNLHPRRSGRPPVGANLRGNPAGSRAEQAPAPRLRREPLTHRAPPAKRPSSVVDEAQRAFHGLPSFGFLTECPAELR